MAGTGLLLSVALGSVDPVRAQEPPAVQIETLMRTGTSWDGVPYTAYPGGAPEITVLQITVAPHSALAWHTHPMPNAAYVLSGEITVEKKSTGEKKLIKKGQVLPEMVNALHRGVTGDAPVVLIVFYAGTKGMPLSQH
ncbi:MAG TPA: cupin domain-containing protein [Herbaspirillum sp.]|jgi:quercetin dioxygenase-like cupin family protein|nr:cupin domain-containing protein [Herbaspirillum sp.]